MDEIAEKNDVIAHYMEKALEEVRNGRFNEAEQVLERALEVDFEHHDIVTALKCAKFWNDRYLRLQTMSDSFERGEYLFKEWKNFLSFLLRLKKPFEKGIYAFRRWVFGSALRDYLRTIESGDFRDPDILFRIGRCYKGIGNYESALQYLEETYRKRREDPEIIAELADCYALIGEAKAAKIFFREAFFLAPGKVNIDYLESELIKRLIERLRGMGYSEDVLKEWLPVYGVLLGVFNVKRELRPLEYGKLKQSIYTLEHQYKEIDQDNGSLFLTPRLINHYFWLIDHYVGSRDSREKVEEIINKIRILDESVYRKYIH